MRYFGTFCIKTAAFFVQKRLKMGQIISFSSIIITCITDNYITFGYLKSKNQKQVSE
jgi:hypothetical protein